MPTTQEFSILVDQSAIYFITLIVRLFLGLTMVLALLFGAAVAMMYCSAKLLVFGYSIMQRITAEASQKKNEVIS